MTANDPSSSFLSSPVRFENQAFSTQIANKIRHLRWVCKSRICFNFGELRLTGFNFSLLTCWQFRWQSASGSFVGYAGRVVDDSLTRITRMTTSGS